MSVDQWGTPIDRPRPDRGWDELDRRRSERERQGEWPWVVVGAVVAVAVVVWRERGELLAGVVDALGPLRDRWEFTQAELGPLLPIVCGLVLAASGWHARGVAGWLARPLAGWVAFAGWSAVTLAAVGQLGWWALPAVAVGAAGGWWARQSRDNRSSKEQQQI